MILVMFDPSIHYMLLAKMKRNLSAYGNLSNDIIPTYYILAGLDPKALSSPLSLVMVIYRNLADAYIPGQIKGKSLLPLQYVANFRIFQYVRAML
jgi:hypothetical protein